MLRTLVGLVAVAAVSVASAAAKPAAKTPSVTGFSDTAETVMGTLTAPPSRRFLTRIRNGKMGGVLLLGNGWLTRHTAATVTAELQQAACTRGEPLLIAVDQEGGLVRRLAWAPPTEAPAYMSSPSVAHYQASGAATALRSVGIDIDLAPVVDTPGSAGNFLGSRAFSRSRTWNARMARAFVGGLQTKGVAATAKHFPGLGLASGNTDHGRIVIRAAAWKLHQGLLPFQSAVRAGTKLVMLSTAVYPKLDGSKRPAAFSSTIINGLLRKQLGFEGVTVTDSLTAPAAVRIPHTATRAMLAGSDLLIFGAESASELGYSTLLADKAGSLRLQNRITESAARVRALKAWVAAHGGSVCSRA
ncbi:MAG TPA: glycoside hydrolase family 3 N-terminal domain-containing protein [Gaiellaceae bacterium]|jgi:beta-N-acetylhexosaminidase|nr:glycoside hydrolase family 3 N-terminal domain-containing protein [Gaiellaceae bacterium]